jgi:hypothetical protein
VGLGGVVTRGTVGLVDETRKGVRVFGASFGPLGWLVVGLGRFCLDPGPQTIHQHAEPQEPEQQQLMEGPVVYHLLSSSLVESTGGILPVF